MSLLLLHLMQKLTISLQDLSIGYVYKIALRLQNGYETSCSITWTLKDVRLVPNGGGFVQVQHSAFYHLACRYVYPIVCNYTDPALDALHHSGFIKEMVDHLRPHAGSAPDSPVSDLERESFRRCCLIV